MKNKYLVFIIEDDPMYRQMISDELSEISVLRIQTFSTGEECLQQLYHRPDIIILDYYLNKENPKAKNGLQILEEIQKERPDSKIIVLSSQLMPDVTFDFIMKKGVYSYIVKEDTAFENLVKSIRDIIDDQSPIS
jgi:DNA-binding NarL/FixJ family response regulator